MNYIIDTQSLIWFIEGNTQLDQEARKVIEDPRVSIFASIAGIWEKAIKVSIGKLNLSQPLERFVAQLQKEDIQILGIESSHVFELLSLPFIHKDPFDRIIIAQAIVEGLEIITSDDTFKNYPVKIL